MLLKKKRASNTDLSGEPENPENGDDVGNGLFDRFSAARKTLTRGSTRRKKEDEDTKSLNEVLLTFVYNFTSNSFITETGHSLTCTSSRARAERAPSRA